VRFGSGGGGSPPTIPRMISVGLKLLDDGDSHSIEQQYPLILRSLHDQRQGTRLLSRLKLERMGYLARTGGRSPKVRQNPLTGGVGRVGCWGWIGDRRSRP
jgi:hypothetical protein